jgi:hypothetical protein
MNAGSTFSTVSLCLFGFRKLRLTYSSHRSAENEYQHFELTPRRETAHSIHRNATLMKDEAGTDNPYEHIFYEQQLDG